MRSSRVSESWNRINKWLENFAPDIQFSLNDAASTASIAELQNAIGQSLPDDFMQSWQIHDGQQSDGLFPHSGFLGVEPAFAVMPVKEIVQDWKMLKSLLDGGDFRGRAVKAASQVVAQWWDPAWIPFATNGGGDYLCFDLNPAPGGTRGQIILFQHDDDKRKLMAASLSALLEKLASGLEAGTSVVTAGGNIAYK
jgi:cell wall assembly regulator SMI1